MSVVHVACGRTYDAVFLSVSLYVPWWSTDSISLCLHPSFPVDLTSRSHVFFFGVGNDVSLLLRAVVDSLVVAYAELTLCTVRMPYELASFS